MSREISRRALIASAVVAGCLGGWSAANAQEWAPTKTVRIVVPIVGSTNDVIARLVAPELQKALGQPVIVENRGGAGGNIGTQEVARSEKDGHTLMVGFNGPLAINKTLYDNLPYDPEKDLAPITLAVISPQYLVVNAKVKANNVKEFVELAKTSKLNYGSVSNGSASHLTFEMFKSAANIDVAHAPYRGAAPAVTDLIAGNIDAAFMVPGNVQQFVKEGRLRLLANTGEKRFASAPEVPTMIESGYPGFLALSWVGFLTVGGTPKPIVDRYHKEITQILKSPEVKPKLEGMEFDVLASTPEYFANWIKAEIPRWGTVIKSTGAKPD